MKLIVAVNNLGVIGNEGQLPWRCSADLKHFKEKTLGSALIVGSTTWEQCLGKRALPGREMLIVGKNYLSLPEVVKTAYQDFEYLGREVWVIGGSSIYTQLMPLCDEIHISWINDDTPGDTFFTYHGYKGKIVSYYFEVNAPTGSN